MISKNYLKDLTYKINGAAIEVHKVLGPGLLESVYHRCLKYELKARLIGFHSELIVPVQYKEIEIDAQLRCDFLIEDCIVVELKACDEVLPIHEAKLLTYMKLLAVTKGIIYNFNVVNLYEQGQITYVNEAFRLLPEF